MSRGGVGKRAAADMAADIAIRKVLDFLAVHQPGLWEAIRRTVTPHLNVAQVGMTLGAEVAALLKDQLSFLPGWIHGIVDTGLAQSPMSIVQYFREHQIRQDVVDQVSAVLGQLRPEELAGEIERSLLKSPEFRQMAEDAWLGRLMRQSTALAEGIKKSLSSDVRYTLLEQFSTKFNQRNPDLTDAEGRAAADFVLWFMRQNDSVGRILAYVLSAADPVQDPLDLLDRHGLATFVAEDDEGRLEIMSRIGERFNSTVAAPVPRELFGPDEPTNPVARYHHRQRAMSDQFDRMLNEAVPVSGAVDEIGRYYRQTYERINGPLGPEAEEQLQRFLATVSRLSLKHRKAFGRVISILYDIVVLHPEKQRGEAEEKMKRMCSPEALRDLSESDLVDLQEEAEQVAQYLEILRFVGSHLMSGLVGTFESMSSYTKPRQI